MSDFSNKKETKERKKERKKKGCAEFKRPVGICALISQCVEVSQCVGVGVS